MKKISIVAYTLAFILSFAMAAVAVEQCLPTSNGLPTTPSNTATFDPTNTVYIGGAGDLAVRMRSGGDVTYNALAVGYFHCLQINKLYNSTTATGVIRGY